jgi:hypothetical protein
VLVTALAVGAVVAGAGLAACGGSGASRPLSAVVTGAARPDWEFVIPLGTAERLARGEQVFIMPSPLDVKVGQVISIRNDDDKAQLVGPFFVGAHQTMVQRFASPGTLQGACQIHPSGQLVVNISAA